MESNIIGKEITFNLLLNNDHFWDLCLRYSDENIQENNLSDDFQSESTDADEDGRPTCADDFECVEFLGVGQELSSIISGDVDEHNSTSNIPALSSTDTQSRTGDWKYWEDFSFSDNFNETCDSLDLIEPSFDKLDPNLLKDYSQIFHRFDIADTGTEDFNTTPTLDNDCRNDNYISFSYHEKSSTDVLESWVFEEFLDNRGPENEKFVHDVSYSCKSIQSDNSDPDSFSNPADWISTSISGLHSQLIFKDSTTEMKKCPASDVQGQVSDCYLIPTTSPSHLGDVSFLRECASGQEMFGSTPSDSTTIIFGHYDHVTTVFSSSFPYNCITNGDKTGRTEVAQYNTQEETLEDSLPSCTDNSGKINNSHRGNSTEKSLPGNTFLGENGCNIIPESSLDVGRPTQQIVNNTDALSVDACLDSDSTLTNSSVGKPCKCFTKGFSFFNPCFLDGTEKCVCPRVNIGVEDKYVTVRAKDVLSHNVKDAVGFFKEKKSEKQIGRDHKDNMRLIMEKKQKRLKKESVLTLQ